jgi:hypothetical protein
MAHKYSSDSALPKEDAARVAAESKSFAAFERSIDEQLTQLVALWIHTAAPNAKRADRLQQRLGR